MLPLSKIPAFLGDATSQQNPIKLSVMLPFAKFCEIALHATHEYKNLHQLILATLVIHLSHFRFMLPLSKIK